METLSFKKKLVKVGESFAFIVPKAYVENGLIIPEIEYLITLSEAPQEITEEPEDF